MKSKTKEGKRRGDTVINHGCNPNSCVVIEDLRNEKNNKIRTLIFIVFILVCLSSWQQFKFSNLEHTHRGYKEWLVSQSDYMLHNALALDTNIIFLDTNHKLLEYNKKMLDLIHDQISKKKK